jgi:hypothetical protein
MLNQNLMQDEARAITVEQMTDFIKTKPFLL